MPLSAEDTPQPEAAREPAPARGECGWEALAAVLGLPSRRHLLAYLRRVERPVTIRAAFAYVLAREHGLAVSEVAERDRARASVLAFELRARHLPALEAADLVEWRREAGELALTDRARELPLFSPLASDVAGLDSS